ncbi:MAG: lytic transglycosylase domain-containing protein [Magnetococcales bacterium]|nr:lytic transglycosylase domain-containing protein [Magnetococcales bacterium]
MVSNKIRFALLLLIPLSVWSLTLPVAMAKDSEEVKKFKALFKTLQGQGSLQTVMDRSTWPNNDRLASYLEMELLFHPNYEASVARLKRFVERWPNHPHIEDVRRFLEIRISRTSQNDEALAWYDSNKPVLGLSQLRYLELLIAANRHKEARSLWRTLYTSGTMFSPLIERKMADNIHNMTASEHEKRARYFLGRGQSKPFREVLKRLSSQTKNYLLTLEAAKKSQIKFESLVGRLPKEQARSSELWLARIDGLRRSGYREKAKDLLFGAEGEYLTSQDRQRQRYRLARLYALHGETKTAVEILEPNIQESDGKLEDSLWLAAWYAHMSGNKEKANRFFEMLADKGASMYRRSQGAYWAARTTTGNQEERQSWLKKAAAYPETFYGLMAIEEASGTLLIPDQETIPCPPLSDPALASELETLQLLVEVERDYYIGPEIERIAKNRGLSQTDQLCMAQYFTVPDWMIKSARLLKRKGEKHWSGLFPVPNWKPRWGWQVDPALIWGMARQESLFFHRAKSSANAYGLLQLIPETARQESAASGFPVSNSFLLKQPDYNISVGQAYIKRMLTRFDGDLVLALIAYNAGPSRADRWWNERRNEPDPLTYIENIPIGETRHYVKRVIAGWMVYQLNLYGKASMKTVLGAGQPGIESLVQ